MAFHHLSLGQNPKMDHAEQVKRKTNPRERANIFSLLTFLYTGKLFARAFRKDLEDDDLYKVIHSCESKKCGDKLEKHFNNEKKKRFPSTARMLWKCYGTRYVSLGAIHLCFRLVNSVMEPEAIGKLVAYFNPNQTKLTFEDAIYYAGIMLGLKLLHCLYLQNYMIYFKQLALQIRTAFCSLIYRKALKLTPSALVDISLGNIITIMTKDVLQFETSIWLFNDMWISMIQVFVICYLLYAKIGLASTVGIFILISVTPLQIYFGTVVKSMRLKINEKTDERLQITQESLSSIKIIKMYTWEKFFGKKIDQARKKEMQKMMRTYYLKSVMILTTFLGSKIGFYSLIMTYIWLHDNITAEVLFYIMRCFVTLKHTIAHSVAVGMQRVAELSASLTRIDSILNAEELEDLLEKPSSAPKVYIKNANLTIRDTIILRNINFTLEKGLTVITGPLGCGKSSLVKVMLKDYPISDGVVETIGRKSYASQDPWLFPSSIKQNILFGEKYDEQRYREVVRVCALQFDFELFDHGDETIVADRGLNLSKGQQARVNLARAVYKDSDIYFLDDCLTALDPQVQEFIFKECVKGFLKDKLCVLVTHNPKHIAEANRVVVLEKGVVKDLGSDHNPNSILSAIEETDLNEKNLIITKKEENGDYEETSKLLKNENKPKKAIYHEVKKEGSVSTQVYAQYFKFGGGIVLFSAVIAMFVSSQFTESYTSKLLTNWVNIRQNLTDLSVDNITQHETVFNSTLNTSFATSNDTLFAIERLELQSDQTLKMYSFMIMSFVVLELLKSYFVLTFAKNASVRLHRSMMDGIIFSVISFFDSHFIGNILNRFAQDLTVIDEQLPFLLSRLIGTIFQVGGIIILIAVVNWRFFIPCMTLVVFLMLLRCFYIPAARSLKRLESAARSPIVGHLNSSMEGLTTIRAYKAQAILRNEFDRHQDLYTSAHYTTFCVRRAFGFYIDLCSVIFLAIIVGKFLFFNTAGTAAGDIGLAITQAAGLSMIVQKGLIEWSEVETLMTSVERVLEYTHLEKENTSVGMEIENWPSKGEITYTNVSLTYANTNERVLKDISFKIKSKQKIGIVGRTGAGKSSIISTLFRLYNYEGQIFIDGVDIKNMSLGYLRRNISIIPQDPIMFAGTIRSNIDPLGKYNDEEIWKTIKKIQLESIIPSLDLAITDNNSNFSTGQRQLICLARAIIRGNRIVVLDEATANMDPETDYLIQKAIGDNFSSCTVIVIAHRLHSILDCNRVMVMDKGRIVEFDEPDLLARDESSVFHGMLSNTGISSQNR